MKKQKNVITGLVSLCLALVMLVMAGCDKNKETPAPANVSELTLSLDATLDGGGDVKAASFTKAELLNTAGTVVKTATLSGGTAQFDMGSLAAGDYFIRVNGLNDDLVPTRIDDPAKDLSQFVGKKLRMTVIGSRTDPTYRMKSYSKGQGEHAVVQYSDGASETPEQHPYALVTLKTTPQKMEVRVLGTAALLTSYSAGTHSSATSFATWVLGGNNHGKSANYPNDAACTGCHVNVDTHAAQYSSITTSNGWCYKCHYGKGGDPDGMVDPNQ